MRALNRIALSLVKSAFVAALISCAVFLTSLLRAEDYSPAVRERMAAVERGLIPAVRVKGVTKPRTIEERMAGDRVMGMTVAVINNYTIEWSKGYGVTDAETGKPVTTETLFQAASISKPLTALAALKLADQGKLDLDADVNARLKSWSVPENEFTREHTVDLRGLLSHTAGLTVHGFPGYAVGESLPTPAQILNGAKPANTEAVRVNKTPGRGFRYSGGGTTIVQQLLIDVSGRPFDELMRDTVLTPLGMSTSTYEQPLPKSREDQAASAHDSQGRPIKGRWHVYPEQGAAGLWTTPTDLARYAVEVQQAARGKSDKVLSRKMLDAMLTPQGGGPVGLGPFITERRGMRAFGHGGQNLGFSCHLIALLDRGQGVVVMTNSDVGHRTLNEVINAVAAVYDWPGYLAPEQDAAQVDKDQLDRLAGIYALNVASVATIALRDGHLYVKLPRMAEMEMYPRSETEFITEQPEITGHCELDDQGKVAAIVFKLDDREVRAKRAP